MLYKIIDVEFLYLPMVHSRCLYQITLGASLENREACKIGRSLLERYFLHASSCLNCEVKDLRMHMGNAIIFVMLNPELSLDAFLEKIKTWTSSWIREETDLKWEEFDFWDNGIWVEELSPEELKTHLNSTDLFKKLGNTTCPNNNLIKMYLNSKDLGYNHHIIFKTLNAKLSLHLKYQLLLENKLLEICKDLGANEAKSVAMRNHIHLLCKLPSIINLTDFTNLVKTLLLEWMHSNLHFRKFDNWDEETLAYTFSMHSMPTELYNLYHQEQIHSRYREMNEMARLFRKTNLPYNHSLH